GDGHIHDFAVLQSPQAYGLLGSIGVTLDHPGLLPHRECCQPRCCLVCTHKARDMAHWLPHRRSLGLELAPDSRAELIFDRMGAPPCGREPLSPAHPPGALPPRTAYLPLAPRIPPASISTRSSGAASALTSTSAETGKSSVKNSRRALQTSSRRLISVTK